MSKIKRLTLVTILIIFSQYSSANLINISVDFEASEFSDSFGIQAFPFPSISGSTSFSIDTSANNTGVYISEVTPSFLDLVIDGKVWVPAETLIAYIFQNNVLTHFTLGGVIGIGDSPFGITGTENDFTIDRQGNAAGGASVALQSIGTIFNSKNLILNVEVTQVSAPSVSFLGTIGIFLLLAFRQRFNFNRH